jgi:5-methylcytosine-specific restriction protein B
LITLIEEDKREGEDNELSTLLPYSKTKFSVPTNLYIIGTLNTADRSVEALDIALRRRFSFVEMPPRPNLIKTVGKVSDGILNGIDLSELLETINKRIEKLLDKDHMIGHSYFLSVSDIKNLKKVFQNKIIPLLQEYFFGDYGKIGLVVGSGFFQANEQDLEEDLFAPFEEYDSGSLLEKKVYHLQNITEMQDEEFINAIDTLMRK